MARVGIRADVSQLVFDASDRTAAMRRQEAALGGNFAALFDELFEVLGQQGDSLSAPRWAVAGALQAVLAAMNFPRSGRKGRNAAWVVEYLADQRDALLSEYVQRFRASGLVGRQLYGAVARELADPPHAVTANAERRTSVYSGVGAQLPGAIIGRAC